MRALYIMLSYKNIIEFQMRNQNSKLVTLSEFIDTNTFLIRVINNAGPMKYFLCLQFILLNQLPIVWLMTKKNLIKAAFIHISFKKLQLFNFSENNPIKWTK